MRYRLGLDIGTNSLGWCILHLNSDNNPTRILDMGSRIFDDGREPEKKGVPGESSAVQRRTARGIRRRYDRLKMRKANLLKQLTCFGLMPDNKEKQKTLEKLNPLELRNKAISQALLPYETGRALFHLQQRRGFKSNRKDSQGDNQLTPLKEAARDFEHDLAINNETLGQFLYKLHQRRESTRTRGEEEKNNKLKYERYPTRKLVEEEFYAIWQEQAKHYPAIFTEEAYNKIHHAIFFQRPLKPQSKGKCSILAKEERVAWALPSAQHFRIIKEINNLAFSAPAEKFGKKLPQTDREKLYKELCIKGSLTFNQIRKLLNYSSEYIFNLESDIRTKLEGDKTAKIMRDKKCFEDIWDTLTLSQQDAIIKDILGETTEVKEDETLVKELLEQFPFSEEQAHNIIHAPLPSGVTQFGETVIQSILPKMEQGMLEHEAIAVCGWHHSKQYTGEICEELPYYGKILEAHVTKNEKSSDIMVREYGRISNPTVHIALNQVRRLLNTLKQKYSCWPTEIVIETTRNLKNSTKKIAEIEKEIAKNTKKREEWKPYIEKYKGAEATNRDFKKMKLWEELAKDPLHRKCVFSGEQITIEMLFNGEVEIEHILPRSKTLDDSNANLTLATRRANRLKNNNPPYEAFKQNPDGMHYEDILERSYNLPKSKQWRFLPDALEIFESKAKTIIRKSNLDGSEEIIHTELESFAANQLIDTSYIAKIAKKYVAYACEQGERGVTAIPGTLTGMLRQGWGLNNLLGSEDVKNRNDHRHHAIDAFVIAMTTRSMVKKVAEASKKEEATKQDIKKLIPKPWPDFDWNSIKAHVDNIVISYKPDHKTPAQRNGGTSGRLHEETVYGYVGEEEKKGITQLVIKKTIKDIQQKELDNIRDKHLQQKIKDYITIHAGNNPSADALQKALYDFGKRHNVRSIRLLVEKSSDVLVPVYREGNSKPYKLFLGGSNHRAEIYCPKTGSKAGKWQIEIISTFSANQKGFIPQWKNEYPDADHIMTLHMNDMVAYEDESSTPHIARVQKIGTNGQVFFVPHTIAKPDKDSSFSKMAGSMQPLKFRRIYVEIDGSIYDPLGILTTDKSEAA